MAATSRRAGAPLISLLALLPTARATEPSCPILPGQPTVYGKRVHSQPSAGTACTRTLMHAEQCARSLDTVLSPSAMMHHHHSRTNVAVEVVVSRWLHYNFGTTTLARASRGGVRCCCSSLTGFACAAQTR